MHTGPRSSTSQRGGTANTSDAPTDSPSTTLAPAGENPPGTAPSAAVDRQEHVAATHRTPSFVQGRPSFPHGKLSGGAAMHTLPLPGEAGTQNPPSPPAARHAAAASMFAAAAARSVGGSLRIALQLMSGSTHKRGTLQ